MKISAFFLSLLFLLQGTYWNMDDISRIGVLMEHAQFHADAYGDSFFVFLSKHYGELQEDHNEMHDEEKSQHERLPFQGKCCVLVVADLPILAVNHSLPNTSVNCNASRNFHYQDNYASLSCFEIFQPPRMT
jgi:hypothetical protein